MLQIPYLHDLVIIFGSALAVIAISHRLRIPPTVGFLITGTIAGPHGLGFVKDTHHVEIFAELGVVFLLFVIGLELSIEQIKRLKRIFLLGGSFQAVATTLLVTTICYLFGYAPRYGLYFGFLITLSSTAIVLKLYSERGELSAPHGQLSMGILLFQDILIVPLLLIVPVLAGTASASKSELIIRFGGGLFIVAVVFLSGRYLVPYLLRFIVSTGIRELFVISALFGSLGGALLTEFLGFSMALGAFLAGILISESDYRHQLLADMSSIRDFFTSMFFISVGMLLRLDFTVQYAPFVIGLVLGIVTIKFVVLLFSTVMLRYPLRTCLITALGLAQIGEFSFVLIRIGYSHGLLDEHFYQLSIASTVMTMLLTPLMISHAQKLAERFGRITQKFGHAEFRKPEKHGEQLSNHVIVIGFGLNGRHLARVLKAAHCPYVIVDLNGHKVQEAKHNGEPIFYGDATLHEILKECGIATASIVVYAISDPIALRRSVPMARHLNPEVFILVRSWRLFEIEELKNLGANEVIAQEFETSIEIVTIVLTRLHLPGNIIRAQSKLLRADGYQVLRSPVMTTGISEKVALALAAGTTETFLISLEHLAVGKTIRDLALRQHTGATIIAVVRKERSLPNPRADLKLEVGDVLVLVGSHVEIEQAFTYLEQTATSSLSTPEKSIMES